MFHLAIIKTLNIRRTRGAVLNGSCLGPTQTHGLRISQGVPGLPPQKGGSDVESGLGTTKSKVNHRK